MKYEKRAIAAARRSLAADLTEKFLPLEASANETASQSASFVAAMLEGHRSAALPPSTGTEAIELLSEASHHALQARAKIVKAHDILRELPEKLGLAFTNPECPPDFTGQAPLRAVA